MSGPLKLRFKNRLETHNSVFAVFVYDPSDFHFCAKPDLRCQRSLPVAAKAVSRPLLLRLLARAIFWVNSTTSNPFRFQRQTGEEHSLYCNRGRRRD